MRLSVSSGRGTHSSYRSGVNQNTSLKINLPLRKRKPVNIVEFVRSVNVDLYTELDKDRQEEFLENLDAIEMFDTLKEVENELGRTRLDIHYLTDFLEQNQPKLLIGYKQRRSTARRSRESSTGTVSNRMIMSAGVSFGMTSYRPSVTATGTTLSLVTGTARHNFTEYRLNYRTKADMAEKSAGDIMKHIKQIEKEASAKIMEMRARIEEVRVRGLETEETCKSFALHFLANESDLEFLETANEKQLINKLQQFTRGWFQNARGSMATMRLRLQHLQEHSIHFRSELHNKQVLSKALNFVDFEHIIMKQVQLLQEYGEKQMLVKTVKAKTGKASMSMGDEKGTLVKLEAMHTEVKKKIDHVTKEIVKLQKECEEIETSNKKDTKRLAEMTAKQQRFRAPSVLNYFQQEAAISALEKEEKMLKRKINIMNIKLTNLQRRYKLMNKVSE